MDPIRATAKRFRLKAQVHFYPGKRIVWGSYPERVASLSEVEQNVDWLLKLT